MKITDYHRIRFDALDDYVAQGWEPVMQDGKVVVESLCDGGLLVCLVMREVEE